MNPFADDIEAALEAIREDGCEAVWWKPAADDPDAEPWREGAGDPSQRPVNVALFSPRDLGFGADGYGTLSDGSEVPTSAMIALMGAVDFEPELTDWLVLPESGQAEIIRLDLLAPNDIPVLWYVWIKR